MDWWIDERNNQGCQVIWLIVKEGDDAALLIHTIIHFLICRSSFSWVMVMHEYNSMIRANGWSIFLFGYFQLCCWIGSRSRTQDRGFGIRLISCWHVTGSGVMLMHHKREVLIWLGWWSGTWLCCYICMSWSFFFKTACPDPALGVVLLWIASQRTYVWKKKTFHFSFCLIKCVAHACIV